MYDYIFIGGSLANLLKASSLCNSKKILIIEKDSYLGGAWRINTDELIDVDLAGHLIVPENNKNGYKIINYFNKLGIALEHIDDNVFYYETDNWRSNGKQGIPLICSTGWVDFNKKIVKYVNKFSNITIVKKTEVIKVIKYEDRIELICVSISNSYSNCYSCNYLYIPMYCNLDIIYTNSKKIAIPTPFFVPYNKIVNTHIILDIKLKVNCNINLHNNFQGLYDKEPIGVFDRVSVSLIKDTQLILSCRLSKTYKKFNNDEQKIEIQKLILPFLINKKIVKQCELDYINNIYYFDYNCYYRDVSQRRIIYNKINKINPTNINNKNNAQSKILLLNTTYMGHLLTDIIS